MTLVCIKSLYFTRLKTKKKKTKGNRFAMVPSLTSNYNVFNKGYLFFSSAFNSNKTNTC